MVASTRRAASASERVASASVAASAHNMQDLAERVHALGLDPSHIVVEADVVSAEAAPRGRVIFVGLVGRPELNGTQGAILFRRDERYAVRCTRSGEEILVKPRNLRPAQTLHEALNADGLWAFLLRISLIDIMAARLVCKTWRTQLSALFRTAEWQATHLPVSVLCRAQAWRGVLARLERTPLEAGEPQHQWLLDNTRPDGQCPLVEGDLIEEEGWRPGDTTTDYHKVLKKYSTVDILKEAQEGRVKAPWDRLFRLVQPLETNLELRWGTGTRRSDGTMTVYPLDLALRNNAPEDVIRKLLPLGACPLASDGTLEEGYRLSSKKTSPPGTSVSNEDQRYPIHEALFAGAPANVLKLVLERHPEDIEELHDGLTLLEHAALDRNATAIRLILEHAPEAAKKEVTRAEAKGGYALHLFARGPGSDAKRLRNPVDADAALEACELLLAAFPEAAAVATLPRPPGAGHCPPGKRYPLHFAAEYDAPAAVVIRLLEAYPAAAAEKADGGYLPCMFMAGRHLTAAIEQSPLNPLQAVLDAHPPSPEWPLHDLLKLGCAAEEAILARLDAHPGDAKLQDPPTPTPPGRQPKPRGYPLHHAALHCCSPEVVERLYALHPKAVKARNVSGDYPIHIAADAAGALARVTYGDMLRRLPVAKEVCANAAQCCRIFLDEWPDGATTEDDFGGRFGGRRDDEGWWPLHRALKAHAPSVVLEVLRGHTPCDAFGNPDRPCPGRTWATKSNGGDIRRMRRVARTDIRSRQLRYLCSGAEGRPDGLVIRARTLFTRNEHNRQVTGPIYPLGRDAKVRFVDLDPNDRDDCGNELINGRDPSREKVESLEPDPEATESEASDDDGWNPPKDEIYRGATVATET